MTGRTNPEDPKDEKYRTEQEGKIRILVGRMGDCAGGIHSIIHPVNIIHRKNINKICTRMWDADNSVRG